MMSGLLFWFERNTTSFKFLTYIHFFVTILRWEIENIIKNHYLQKFDVKQVCIIQTNTILCQQSLYLIPIFEHILFHQDCQQIILSKMVIGTSYSTISRFKHFWREILKYDFTEKETLKYNLFCQMIFLDLSMR